jgi:hypothetical protein
MNHELILSSVHPDLACAVALGLVENSRLVAGVDAVTVLDAHRQPLGTIRDWLRADEPLHEATREYLLDRREANLTSVRRPGQSGWAAASTARTRDVATQRACQARERARTLLAERGVFDLARRAGLPVLGTD